MIFRRVLTAVDFAPPSRAVLRLGRHLSLRLGVPLTVCHVAKHARALEAVGAVVAAHPERLTMDSARRHVEDVLASADIPASECTIEVLEGGGDAASSLLELAKPTDLLVIGTHGKNRFEELLVGGTAHTLIAEAPCPVLIARPDAAL